MSSRALRRLQKEQQEEQAAQLVKLGEESEVLEEVPVVTKSAFALLNEDDVADEVDEVNEVDEVVDDDEKKSTISRPSTEAVDTPSKPDKKKKKKKKSKNASTASREPDEDDIDAALAALDPPQKQDSAAQSSKSEDRVDTLNRLLSVNSQNLHVINEMRRLFGRDVTEAERRPAAEPRVRARARGQPDPRAHGFPTLSLRRNAFVQGKEEWPRGTTGGLGMEKADTPNRRTGTTDYRFVHSSAYQDTQRQYEIAVASMDPQRLVLLLQQNPYHVATLLQVAEIAKHERAHSEAGDMLEMALFSFGRAIHSTFATSLAAGKARLNFSRPENREFFLACWRYIQNLSMRSTWRTVYEWTKLLYSLDDTGDPYCLTLVMDQHALRANQAENYLQLVSTGTFRLHSTVNWNIGYGVALCHLQLSQHDLARQTLREAMEGDRFTAHSLCRNLDMDPIPPSLWEYHEPKDERHALFSMLYCTRAKDLWNTPEAKSLLSTAAAELLKIPTSSKPDPPHLITMEAARHVYLTENDDFIRLLAQCRLEKGAVLGDRPAIDPFPPLDQIVSYDPKPENLRSSDAPDVRSMLHRIPGFGDQRMTEEQMDALFERLQMHAAGDDDEGAGNLSNASDEEDINHA